MQSDAQWELSRKQFVKSLLISGAALHLPWLHSCSDDATVVGSTAPLSKDQFVTLRAVQEILFPSDGNGPGALEVNADNYLLWVLNDPELDPEENAFIIDKLDEFIAECKRKYEDSFTNLTHKQQRSFVRLASRSDWGKRWTSRLLTLIFEALLIDPQYDVNPEGVGWKWLQHDPGSPRPNKSILYPKLLDRSNEV